MLRILCWYSHEKHEVTIIIVIRTYSLETRAEPAVLRTYVENQAILEPILLYRSSKCKQTKEQGSEDCLWTHIFTFLSDYCPLFSLLSNKTRSNCAIIGCNLSKKHKLSRYKTQNKESNYVDDKFFFNFYQERPTCTKPWGQTSKYYRAA